MTPTLRDARAVNMSRVDALVDRLIAQHAGVTRADVLTADDRARGTERARAVDARRVAGENFKLCERFCAYHLRVHRYREVTREDALREIDAYAARCEVASMEALGERIRVCARETCARWDGRGGVGDAGAAVVTLLLRLAGRPLDPRLGIALHALERVEEDAVEEDAVGAWEGDEDAAESESERASESTLSVWSDEEEEERVGGESVVVMDADAVSERASERDDPGFSWRNDLVTDESTVARSASGALATRDESVVARVPEVVSQARQLQGILRESNARRGDAKLLATQVKTMPSETSLVHGALHAIRVGERDLERVALPHMSCMTLDGALTSIRRMATVLARVREMRQASSQFGPTIQAFAQALERRGQSLMSELAPLEEQLLGDSTTKAIPTLLQLRATVRRLQAKVDAMEHIMLHAFPLEGTPAAEAASHCLTAVYDAASLHQATANIDGFAFILRVFVETIQPYLQGLHRWLALGILDDPCEELFVARGRAVDDFVGSKEHWLHGYVLRHDIETPSFLRAFMSITLDVGRSLVLLHHTESQTSHKVPKLDSHMSEAFCHSVRLALGATHVVDDFVIKDSDASQRARDLISDMKLGTNSLGDVFQTPASLVGIRSISAEEVRDSIILQPTHVVPYRKRRQMSPHRSCVEALNAWLDEFLVAQVPACPMSLLVEKAIGHFIQRRADEVQLVLSRSLRDDLDIKKELFALRAVFLGGAGEAATHFFSVLFNILDDPDKISSKWNDATLNELIADAFALDNSGEFPKERGVQVEIIPEAEQNLFSCVVLGTGALEKIASLRYSFDIKWPHNIVVTPSAMAQYNAVAAFLGQLRRAHIAMQTVTTERWSERIRRAPGNGLGGSRARHLEPRLRHFVASLREHVVTNILQTDWEMLMRAIDEAPTLDAVRTAHDAFLNDATKRCLVSPDPTWTLLAEQIRTILAVACEYAACQGGDGAVSEDDATRLSIAFEDAYAYIERVLQAKLDIGSAETRDAEELLYAIRMN